MVVLAARLLAYLASENGHILLLGEGLAVVDEEEVAHLLQVEQHVAARVLMQRTALHNAGQVEGIVHVARLQYPVFLLVEPARKLQCVVVVHRLAGHRLLANLYGLFLPRLAVVGRVLRQLAVVVHALHDVVAVGPLVQSCQLLVKVQPCLGPRLTHGVLDVVDELRVLPAVQRIVNLSSYAHISNA